MPSIFDPERDAELRQRIARLTPDAPARFGKLDAPRMVCHLIDAYRNALGENPSRVMRGPLNIPLIRWFVIHVMPWPTGVKTAPSYLATPPAEWEHDVQRWNDALTRIAARARETPPRWDPHPAFGSMPNAEWGALLYRHTDYHFRQFGV